MVTYFFYKNLAFGLTLFMYNLHAAASGQVVYNDWLMSAFNIFFVAFPVIALGILDQDVNQRSCLQFPQLYRQGQQNACFERRVQAGWALNGVYIGMVTFFVVFYAVHGGEADHPKGHVFGLWEVGTSLYTGIVITINLQMAQMINFWTWIHHVCIWGSIAFWYIANCILSNTDPYLSTYSYKIFIPTIAPTPKFWMATPFIVVIGLLPDLLYRTSRRLFRPEPHQLVQEYERMVRGTTPRSSVTNTPMDTPRHDSRYGSSAVLAEEGRIEVDEPEEGEENIEPEEPTEPEEPAEPEEPEQNEVERSDEEAPPREAEEEKKADESA